jgi:hypothetical protein
LIGSVGWRRIGSPTGQDMTLRDRCAYPLPVNRCGAGALFQTARLCEVDLGAVQVALVAARETPVVVGQFKSGFRRIASS